MRARGLTWSAFFARQSDSSPGIVSARFESEHSEHLQRKYHRQDSEYADRANDDLAPAGRSRVVGRRRREPHEDGIENQNDSNQATDDAHDRFHGGLLSFPSRTEHRKIK